MRGICASKKRENDIGGELEDRGYFDGRQRGIGEAVDNNKGLEDADDELQCLEEDSK